MIWRHVMLALPEIESASDHVLDRAGRIARGLAAEVQLFHCVYDPHLGESAPAGAAIDELIRGRVDGLRRRLERVADRLRDQHLEVHSDVRWDYPIFEAIVRQALRRGPSLLIVPSTHMGRETTRTLSYTDARLIETCPCPLLLLRTTQVYSQGPIVAAIDPGHAHEKPLELDETIVAAAKTLSDALSETPVHLYHAVPPLSEPNVGPSDGETPTMALSPEHQKVHWVGRDHAVRKIAARHDLSGNLVRVELGYVESSLPLYVREVRADAVVMGAVSRSYSHRALFGYTAEKVLDALECDVLIVKPEGFRSPVPRRPPGPRVSQAEADRSGVAAQFRGVSWTRSSAFDVSRQSRRA
jgi:universal stress protein E